MLELLARERRLDGLLLALATVAATVVLVVAALIVVLIVCALSIGLNFIALLYLIPTMLVEYVLALGIAFIVSGITVYFRDLEHFLGIAVMAWQFLTPVMYSVDMVPERLRALYSINPMTPVIIAYRTILYYKAPPDLSTMLSSLIMGLVFLFVGWFVFDKLEKRFAEVL